MNDPKRWLEGGDATDLERDLLGAGARMSAPRGMQERAWQGIGTKLSAAAVGGAVGGAVAASTSKAAASTVGGGAVAGGGVGVGAGAAAGGAAGLKVGAAGTIAFKTKLVIAAFVVAGASTGGALVATRMPEAPAKTAPSTQNVQSAPITTTSPKVALAPRAEPSSAENTTPVVEPPPMPPVVTTTNEPPRAPRVSDRHPGKPIAERAPAREATAANERSAAKEPEAKPNEPTTGAPEAKAFEAKPEAASRLREDARAIRDARAALGAGDPAAAEAQLAGMSSGTLLAPERDALRVRIAEARGDHARARSLAEAFLRSYPKSPLAPQMTKIVTGSTNE